MQLAQIDIQSARQSFDRAIELDSADPLPRLGLGLATIRGGDLEGGRQQIEIAVVLDPTNSLVRSYLGKAYFEENTSERDKLASSQYGLAKELDPKDPTPWFYDAILKQTQNRPVEALDELQRSIELNDNRAVFRSRLLLDQDQATRSVSLARIYDDLGFDQQATLLGGLSVNTDPSNSSAHRFLADSYLSQPRREIARQSELLQSQLLQPLNATPIQPVLTEDKFVILRGSGPSAAGFGEYTPLFTRNGFTFQGDFVGGNLNTLGDQIIFSGVQDRISFALSQLAYTTDGFRENDDFRKSILDGFLQVQVSPETSIQGEIRQSNSDFGDPLLSFDPQLYSQDRHDIDDLRGRLGVRQRLGPGSDLIASFMSIDQTETIDAFGMQVAEIDTRTTLGELQYQLTRPGYNIVLGGGYATEDQDAVFFGFPSTFRPYGGNAYAYLNLSPWSIPLRVTLGASVDHLADRDNLTPERTEVNPKLGLTASPWKGATLRAAAFKVLRRRFITSQTIEPTQVAGFNQFYDDLNATESDVAAVALDQTLRPNLFAGVELGKRDLTVPFDLTGEEYEWQERTARAYVYWAPTKRLAFTAGYTEETFSRPLTFPGPELITDVTTQTVPLSAALFLPNGFFANLGVTYVRQHGDFFPSGSPEPVPGKSEFWVVDLGIGVRLPRRRGIISLEVRNLFDEQFQFQETDLFSRQFARERFVLMRLSLAFF